jgi:hypothetical protein
MMKRYIAIIAALLLVTTGLKAQNTFRVNYQIAVPMGAAQDFIDVSAFRGMSFEYYHTLMGMDDLHLGFEAGWNFFHKVYDRQTYEFDFGAVNIKQWRYKHVVPVLFNTMYDMHETDLMKFYAKFGLGPYFVNDEVWAGLLTIAENKAFFGMVPGLGFSIHPSETVGFNFAAEYQFIVNGQLQLDGRAHAHYWNFKFGLQFGGK